MALRRIPFTITLLLFATGLLKSQVDTVRIYEIQGSGTSSAYDKDTVLTEGVLTAKFYGQAQSGIDGFFLQDTAGDGDPLTSDGIFVYSPNFGQTLTEGNYYRLLGVVEEFFGLTELKIEIGSASFAEDLGPGPEIQAAQISLPLADSSVLERYEGMKVRIDQRLLATDVGSIGRFGEITFATEILEIPTNEIDVNDDPRDGNSFQGTSNIDAYRRKAGENRLKRIVVDDGYDKRQYAPLLFSFGPDSSLRAGSTIDSVEGILNYLFGSYKIELTMDELGFSSYAPRETSLPDLGNHDLRIAAFNIENYFSTIGGSRGASSQEELDRQTAKIVAALIEMDADIYALIEVESNGENAARYLLDALNAELGSSEYALMNNVPYVDPYDIRNFFIYKSSTVEISGDPMINDDPLHIPPPVAQAFQKKNSGYEFIVVACHYQFKGNCEEVEFQEDADQKDGQGCWNYTRVLQSQNIAAWVSDSVMPNYNNGYVMLLGDFNAYYQEDPMDALRTEGYVSLHDEFTYAFAGEFGSLDHVLVNDLMLWGVSGCSPWRINSTETDLIEYPKIGVDSFYYRPDPFRSSDHDPVLIGINTLKLGLNALQFETVELEVFPNPVNEELRLRFESGSAESGILRFFDLNGRLLELIELDELDGGMQQLSWNPPAGLKGMIQYDLRLYDAEPYRKASGSVLLR